jgi:signal transduction histidine kinase
MPQENESLGALLRMASWLHDARSLHAIAERSLELARSLGSGHAHVVLRSRSRRGRPTTVVLGDVLEESTTSLRIDVPLDSMGVEGTLSLTRTRLLGPIDPSHLALLGSLIGLAVERASLAFDLDESDLERRELVAKIAHDIRTPLQSFSLGMDAVTAAMSLEPPQPKVIATLARMGRSATSLGHVVDDVEDASLIYDSGLRLHPASHPPDRLIARACETRATTAAAGGSAIVAVPSGLAAIACDGPRITRVLSILIDNALRYSPRGTTVTLRASERGGSLRFEVEDDGPGLAETIRGQILARPFRGKPNGKVGLGLYLASAIAVAHGGTIEVSVSRARGVTFGLVIPLARASSVVSAPGAA